MMARCALQYQRGLCQKRQRLAAMVSKTKKPGWGSSRAGGGFGRWGRQRNQPGGQNLKVVLTRPPKLEKESSEDF
jgi:hypothetical protein